MTANRHLLDNSYNVLRAEGTLITEEIEARTGLFHTRVHERVIARYPTASERELLRLLNQAPVLEITHVGQSDRGVVTMFSRIVWNAIFCELTYDYPTRDVIVSTYA